uniref:ATP-grasp fold PylC-type domain-containing protein n=1 Tax=viral metagenome TaxID=1070528 RepID=A0A6C0LFQ4_9ZZZZ
MNNTKRVLVFYGYYEWWDESTSWGKKLYEKAPLLQHLSDYIDDVIIMKDIGSLRHYLNGDGLHCKNYILPTLHWHVQELLSSGIKSLFSAKTEFFDRLYNKKDFFHMLKERDLLHYSPSLYYQDSDRNSDQLVVVKHSNMSSSVGLTKKKLNEVQDWEFDEHVVQEYVYGSEEYDAVFVFNKGKITLAFAFLCGFDQNEHIKAHPDTKITSYNKVILDDNIKNIIEEVMEPCYFTGTCCFDFKLQNGQMRIFEINPRLDGALASPWNKEDLINVIRNLIQNFDSEFDSKFEIINNCN